MRPLSTMVPRRNTHTTVSTGGDVHDSSSSSAAIERAKTPAAASSMKRRQTSLRNFFGTAGKTNQMLSKRDTMKTSDFYPMTPPTPVSPQTPLTPPTAQEAPFATPPSPADDVIFKKAKRETTAQILTEFIYTGTTTVRNVRPQKKALEQTYLDLGQGDFGKRTICNTCGMLYVHGLDEDSQQHSRICLDYIKGVPFSAPQARVVASHSNGLIVEVSRAHHAFTQLFTSTDRPIHNLALSFYYAGTTFRWLFSSKQGETCQGNCGS